ncbi:MAG: YcgL domain-containing protein [Gammaproteobacteria bacterium]
MQCYIYKSIKKQDIYIYLRNRDDFTCLPAPLLESLGRMEFVFCLEITPERKLANADPSRVIDNLSQHGFFLQLPPVFSVPATLQ